MRYDTTHLEPQFILDMGKPGSSFAFEIAQKIGLPTQIIENARKKLGKNQVDFDKLLMETETEKQIWESKNSSLAAQLAQAERIKEQYSSLKQLLEEDQKRLLNSAKAEAKQLIKDANQKIEQTIREIKEKSAEKEATKAIRNTLTEFATEKLANPVKKNEPKPAPAKPIVGIIEVGSWVAIKQADGEGAVGQVLELKGKDAVVALGSIRSTIKLNRLEKAATPKAEKATRVAMKGIDMNSRMAQFTLTLDVRGKRGEEVYVILDQYMNDAILLGVPEVHILHGKGDGILRALVKEQLKRYREIKSVQDEHADRGGAGISIIQFK
jgi:DNA mismatch repair protein MutS2